MLKATMTQPNGRPLILLGLSKRNWQALAPVRDMPLMVRGEELDLDFDVVLWTGTDERTMAAQLRDMYGITEFRESDPAPEGTAPEPAKSDVQHGPVPEAAMRAANQAAYDALIAHGVQEPAMILIAQDGEQRRGMASNIQNPADLLRVVLWNLERRR